MKTNVPIMIDDEQRARVRAYYGRAGLATRAEIRMFAIAAVGHAVENCPDPKRRRRVPLDQTPRTTRMTRAAAASDETVCRHCQTSKSAHGKMAFTCPPASGRPKGQTFEANDREIA